MISYYLFCFLILCINGLTTADNVDGQQVTQPSENTNATVKPEKLNPLTPNSNQTEASKKGKCKPSEILTAHKGCVDREAFLERLLANRWADENMDEAKKNAGLEQTEECKEGEILSAFGCVPEKLELRTQESERQNILHSHLYGNKVFKSSDGIPDMDKIVKDSNRILGSPVATSSKVGHSPQNKARKLNNDNENDSANIASGRIVGHNRPRSYVFMPGRRLQSNRKCRPYEVLARKDRCIRKRGKTGLYKHNDHEYGVQLRHRHEAFKPNQTH